MTHHNLEAWEVRPEDYPEDGSAEEQLRFLLRYSVLAPSSHNTQPWRFHLEGGTVDLFADRRRALPLADPQGRELVMSCGAALCNLLLALHHFGWGSWVERLPHGEESDHLARVALWRPTQPAAIEHRLFWCIPRRHTCRVPFREAPLPAGAIAALQKAAAEEGARLVVVDEARREDLVSLIEEGDRILDADPALRRELADWMRTNFSHRPDGLPGYSLGLGDLMSLLAPAVMRHFNLGEGHAEHDRELARTAPLLGVIETEGDRVKDWLQAGRALQRVLLTGVAMGMQASFLNQPVQVAELRPRLTRLLQLEGHPQMVLRMGFPPREEGQPTPRLTVSEVLD